MRCRVNLHGKSWISSAFWSYWNLFAHSTKSNLTLRVPKIIRVDGHILPVAEPSEPYYTAEVSPQHPWTPAGSFTRCWRVFTRRLRYQSSSVTGTATTRRSNVYRNHNNQYDFLFFMLIVIMITSNVLSIIIIISIMITMRRERIKTVFFKRLQWRYEGVKLSKCDKKKRKNFRLGNLELSWSGSKCVKDSLFSFI